MATIIGTSGDDTLSGGQDADFMNGDDGNDVLIGNGGTDTLLGASGNDTLYGGNGDDLISGGSDADTLYGSYGDDTVEGGAGADLLFGGGSAGDSSTTGDTLSGGDDLTAWTPTGLVVSDVGGGVYEVQDDTANGYHQLALPISGFDTSDTVTVSLVVRAGSRSELILNLQDSAPSDVTFDLETGVVDYLGVGIPAGINDLGDGWQQIWVTAPADSIDTSNPTAYLVAWDPSSETWPRQGTGEVLFEVRDFQFEPGATSPSLPDAFDFGIDMLSYESSAAAVTVDLSTGAVSGGDATGDTIDGFDGVIGSAHDDMLTGDDQANILSGGGGNDTLSGGDGADTIEGGTGADILYGGGDAPSGGDTLSGGDDLTAWTPTGLVVSDVGGGVYEVQDDTANGYHQLALPISGFDTSDTVTVSLVVRAGSRSELILNLQDSAPSDVTFDLETGVVDYLGVGIPAGINDLGDGWQQIWVTAPADSIDTSNPTAYLVAWDPSSETWPRQGTGEVLFEVRDFQFEPGATSPSLPDAFNLVTDMLSYESSAAAVTVDLSTGAASGGDATGDTIDGFEGVIGSAHDDMLTGDDQANILSGGSGNDTLSGGDGADTLYGGAGNDVLYDDGTDTLYGGDGFDIVYTDETSDFSRFHDFEEIRSLDGSVFLSDDGEAYTGDSGDDLVYGGTGNDTIDGASGNDTLYGGNGDDLISGGSDADTLYGSYGDDTVEGGAGADLLFGGGSAGDSSTTGDTLSGGDDLTAWTPTGLVVSDVGGGVYEVQDDTANGYHQLALPISGFDTSDTVTVSLVVRAGSRSELILNLQDSAPSDVTFDLETGVVDYLGVGIPAGINDLGDGWQQIWVTAPADSIDTSNPTAYLVAWDPSSETWPRQGTGEVLFEVRDFQFEPGATSPSLPDAFDFGIDMLSYESSAAAVTVDLSTGAVSGGDATGDTIDGFDGVIGSAHDDMLTGDDQANILSGGGGNDTLSGGDGADTIEGGTGADILYGGGDAPSGGDTLSGGDDLTAWTPTGLVVSDVGGGVYEVQDDTANGYHQLALPISGFDTSDTVTVSLVVRAGSRSELILNLQDSAPSDVTFDLETGVVDYLGVGIPAGINDLGDGWQQIWVTAPADSIDTSNPTAYLVAWDPSSETWPRQGTGEVLFEVRDFQFEPGATSPSLPDAFNLVTDMLSYESSAAAVTVDLSTGAASGGDATGDTIDGFEGVIGSAHDDMLTGDDQANILSGGGGNDTLSGGDGADTLYGGAGNDVLYDDGTDTLYGGDGFDIVYTDETSDFSRFHDFEEIRSLDGSVFLSDDGEAYTGDSGDDLVYGGTGNDTIDGASGNDTLYGGNGDDSLTGNAGDDLLYGGDGDDLLRGYGGDDTLYGEGGNDHLSAGGDDDLIYGGTGNDTINGRGGDDTIYGEDGDDHITTGFSNDAGSDVVIAGNGADTVIGFTGNDTIFGNAGSDSLFGDSGADYIAGGVNDDTLTGGGGADVFAFNAGDNADVITDFAAGTDKLDLDASFGITSQTALDAIASADQSGNTILDFGNGDTITLIGTNPSELSINDII